MQRYGAMHRPPGNILAAVHRGRISIFAAMTIGEQNIEQVVLKEVNFGENVALRTYQSVLKKELPAEVRSLVQRQYEEIRAVIQKIQMMRGKDGQRLMVRLYDTEEDAQKAIRKLKESGQPAENISSLPIKPLEPYTGPGPSLWEIVLSGAVGGAVWGMAAAILSAISIFQAPLLGLNTPTFVTLQNIVLVIVIGLIIGGIFVGGGLGFFIGLGIRNEDAYLYDQSLKRGQHIVEVLTDESIAARVWQMLAQVNMEARTQTG